MFFGIRDGKKLGSGIRDKHPGSATLPETMPVALSLLYFLKGFFLVLSCPRAPGFANKLHMRQNILLVQPSDSEVVAVVESPIELT
jgi:hypothetical protein